jgi:hypothetical protein
MFDVDGYSESITRPYFKQLGKEGFVWFLEDVVEAAKLSGLFERERLLDVIATRINEIDCLFDSNEETYWGPNRASRSPRPNKNVFAVLSAAERNPIPAGEHLRT